MSRISVLDIAVTVFIIPIALVVFYFAFVENTFLPLFQGVGKETVYIGNVPINVDVANTEEERTRGLGGRVSLPPNQGLLFVFKRDASHGIWMKGMQFPIDIIWIGRDLRVVDIVQSVQPDSYPEIFYPRANARYVIEVNALFAEVWGINIGDSVKLPSSLIVKD